MKRNVWILLSLLSITPIAVGCAGLCAKIDSHESEVAQDAQGMELWPEIEPFRTGFLKVSDLHELYYELCGNPRGRPVFVLHGGPGSGCSPYMRRFFDPEKFLIVLHDQRGAKRSKPYAEVRENTTQDLVEDIERLRRHLGIEKAVLFGGSWGATLGLAYAETYPESVSGMVLRGIFTATSEEIEHFYHGGVIPFFPEAFEKLTAALPDPERRPIPGYLLELIRGEDPAEKTYSNAWGAYEIKLCTLEISDERIDEILEEHDFYAFSLLENYYMANGCFLEEGQLFRDAGKIRHIPAVLVNGRYDMICPPATAYRLHRLLPESKLVIVEGAGHWMGDKPIQQALLKAMKEFE